jgi:inositol-phosphate phosphatase/L-galactose 1-phosphate phosphatase/histidinol-phosphatase
VPPHELDDFITLALRLADAAGEAIRPYFRQPLTVDDKADLTPVTIADRAAEQAMRSLIESRFPEHGIIGEEFGRLRDNAEFVWTLDPIDGTKSFISGVPLFGTLIALTRANHPILGVIDQPISRERWVGRRYPLCHDSRHVQGWRRRGFLPGFGHGQTHALRRRLLCLWLARRGFHRPRS